MPEFIHLHNHSHYSLLDGACRPVDLINAAAANKMSAVALTDHGVMFGALEFYKKANKAGVKPIIGSETYIVTSGTRFDRPSMNEKRVGGAATVGAHHHLVLLVKNLTGYRNLIKLISLAHIEGFYYKPRIDMNLLREHHEGLVAMSACMGGVVAAHLAERDYDRARAVAIEFRELFGDDFYLEIQNHGMEKEKPFLEGMPRLSAELGIKLIATNDVHYIKPDHAVPHNILLLIPDATSTSIQDPTTLRYGTDQIYFKTAEEMTRLFRDFPGAIESTLEVAAKCDLQLDTKTNYMPEFPIPPDSGVDTLDDYLEKLSREGAAKNYSDLTPEIEARLTHELSVIRKMGYSGYFLIVQDFINAARRMGCSVGPGRGSAAGSIVAYSLGITTIDPLRYDLLFERFLNPDRISMPDIDVDFADDKRDKVINYVREKYGEDCVAQIITFGTLSSKAVLKDVGRVLGVPLNVVESITKLIPSIQGKVMKLEEALQTVPELSWVKESPDPKLKQLISYSVVLEGMNRTSGTHAAGVVIAPGPLTDYVPLYKTPQTELMTQYNMKDLEDAGLLKMDFLGITTLRVIERTLELILVRHGVAIDVDRLPLDDTATYELYSRGETVGIFQFESSGMRDYLRRLKPTAISDLVAMNALYRPGPMEMIPDFIARKHGRQSIEYLHPRLEPILRETYGVIVYQEQVIKIASDVAGFPLSKADLMRRAMGKKDKATMAALKKEFIAGAVARDVPKRIAGDIFELIEKFASYGFNKSHSVAYAVLSYQTAYLKAHYPHEFMAALLTAEVGKPEKIVLSIEECRHMGINVLPPGVNESDASFTVTEHGVRFGLNGVRNVGTSAVDAIVAARKGGGEYKNLFDFCRRLDLRVVNRKAVESLIQAGAFDFTGGHRAQLLDAVEKAMEFGGGGAGLEQPGLFDSAAQEAAMKYPSLPDVQQWPASEKLSREKLMLGFYVSGHPLDRYADEVKAFATVQFGDLEEFREGAVIRGCGVVTGVRRKIDRKNQTMAFVTIEDFTGKAECIVFADRYRKYEKILTDEAMLMVVGRGEIGGGERLRIVVNEVHPLDKVAEKFTRGIIVSLNVHEVTDSTIIALRRLVEQNKGNCSMFFTVEGSGTKEPRKYRSTKFVVQASHEFIGALKKLLGDHHVRINA